MTAPNRERLLQAMADAMHDSSCGKHDGVCPHREFSRIDAKVALDILTAELGDHALWRGDVVRLDIAGWLWPADEHADYDRFSSGTKPVAMSQNYWGDDRDEPVFRVAPITQQEPTP